MSQFPSWFLKDFILHAQDWLSQGEGVGGALAGRGCPPVTWALTAFGKVQMPSSGRWQMFRKKSAGSFRGLWKLACEAIEPPLYKLQFVTQIIIFTSSNSMSFFPSLLYG